MRSLYRSLQVPVAPADTDHASIESFAHTHGRLAIVPALKAIANKRLETRGIKDIPTQAMCPEPHRGSRANSTTVAVSSLQFANTKCTCLQKTRRVRSLGPAAIG
jgi:hypothetical protein